MRAKCFEHAGLAGALRLGTIVALASSFSCSHPQPPPPATAGAAGPAAPAPCPTPEPLKIVLQASAHTNPGEKGEALATVVRLYQLKGITKLTGTSFDDLLDHDKEALADEFLGVQEVTVNPGERQEPPVARNADANFLMAVALFRQPTGTTWKAIKKLLPANPDHCHPPAAEKGNTPPPPPPDGTVRFFIDENRIELR